MTRTDARNVALYEPQKYGGEGGIRTHEPLGASVSYRVLVASPAIFAIIAVRHYPKLPKMFYAGI